MKIDNQLRFIVINQQADTLHSLIADGKYRNTSKGRDTWKTPIGSQASLQPHCNKEVFNAAGDSPRLSKTRWALLLTNRMTVLPVTLELVLAQEVYMMTPTRVEIRQRTCQIMETSTSKPWGTSW